VSRVVPLESMANTLMVHCSVGAVSEK